MDPQAVPAVDEVRADARTHARTHTHALWVNSSELEYFSPLNFLVMQAGLLKHIMTRWL
jgi:hypothetical protein